MEHLWSIHHGWTIGLLTWMPMNIVLCSGTAMEALTIWVAQIYIHSFAKCQKVFPHYIFMSLKNIIVFWWGFFFRKKLICTKITCFYVIDKDHQSSECSNLLISICEASTFTSIENIKKKISNIIFLKFGRNVISQKY